VFFDAGSAALGPNERAVISGQASWLLGRPDTVVTIQGHADDPGSEQRNRSLSIARAEAVRSLLLTLGVPAERIRLRPEGNALPVARCGASVRDREICAAQNRRAVSVVTWIDESSTSGGTTGRDDERSNDTGIPAGHGTARAPADR
jgi:peptidoglycan-associated lipoprotein